jgi:eukaryotic-like serine/threonine-protein kinase
MRQPIVFGKYLLLERISVGGMAEVFKAKSFGEEGFEKILAIKRILPSMAEDDEFIQMFIDEAKISGQLSHPNIGQIYELGKIGESHFIAMEFVWGKDVLQIQNRFRRLRGKMPLPMAAYVGARVCEGLDYAHRKKDESGAEMHIIHRDVSPQNVLVSYAGEVKLIDFGIAKARSRSSKTQAGVLKGKFGYMSPEQVRGLPLDHRSDVFAVGTLMYEMTTGERLFTGESDFATLEKVRNSLVPKPSKVDPRIPPALEAIIMTALKRDPDERYESAAELQEELTAYLMQQNPIFTVKTLSTTMTKMFEAERKREEEALRGYLAIRQEDLEALRNSPAARREAAVSLLPKGPPDLEDMLPHDGVEGGPSTQIGAPYAFSEDEAEPIGEDSGEVLTGDDLLEEVEDEEERGSTQIYAEGNSLPAPAAPAQPEQMAAEPTFIFNAESGQLVQLAQQSTVIFGQQGEEGHKADMPDQGPTVIFDAGLSGAVAGSSALPGDEISGTMPVAIERGGGSIVKDILIGVLVALVLILGIVLWKVFSSQRTATPALATVVISASPPLPAEVTVDGVPRGSLEPGMPLTIKDLKPETHQVVIKSPNIPPVEQQVVLAPGDVKVLAITLPVPEKSGRLVLKIEPAGAKVFIDGAEISEQAAQGPIELRSGVAHEVRVVKEGYRESVQRVELSPGEKLERPVVLEKSAGTKVSKVDQPPPKKVEPAEKVEPKVAKVEKPEPKPKKVAAVEKPEPKKVEKVAAVEKPEPRPKKVEKVEKKKVEKPEKVAKVEKPEPKPKKVREPKEPKEPKVAKVDPGEGEAGMGFLVANTVPWAKVVVDGKDTGKTTPVAPRQKIALKPGRHKVTFVVDGKEFTFPITISAGQITRLIKKLPVE